MPLVALLTAAPARAGGGRSASRPAGPEYADHKIWHRKKSFRSRNPPDLTGNHQERRNHRGQRKAQVTTTTCPTRRLRRQAHDAPETRSRARRGTPTRPRARSNRKAPRNHKIHREAICPAALPRHHRHATRRSEVRATRASTTPRSPQTWMPPRARPHPRNRQRYRCNHLRQRHW